MSSGGSSCPSCRKLLSNELVNGSLTSSILPWLIVASPVLPAEPSALNNGSQSFAEGYAGLVEDIGVKTRQSQLDKDAGSTLLEQSTNQRESVSGVNLDEEAGKLIQYQAAYNASAQVVSVAQDLFNTLLQSFR